MWLSIIIDIITFMERANKQNADTSMRKKTIVSIVTPLGEGGIGKVMVSGPNSLGIANKVFQGKRITDLRDAKNQKLYYGYIYDKGQRVDEVIVQVTKKGDSFTGEDTVEINCHGGIHVVMRVYECLQSFGAEGGEWNSLVLQSFENNKMDFIQKEAFHEIMRVRTKLGVKVLLDQYAGALSGTLKQGLEIIELIERFPHILKKEDGVRFSDGKHACVSALEDAIHRLLGTASLGMALTIPQILIILGKPNAGKSTLMNAVLGEDRMLVHHEPGTTRDYVSEFISVDGIPFELIDTAGIRDTHDMLETMGMEMALEQLQRADKVIVVFDNSRPFDQEDERILHIVNSWLRVKSSDGPYRKTGAHMVIPVINKCDLPTKLEREKIEHDIGLPLCSLSAHNGDGIEDLNKRLVQELDTMYKPIRPVVFTKRQYSLLIKASMFMEQKKYLLTKRNMSHKASHVIKELRDVFMACLKGN